MKKILGLLIVCICGLVASGFIWSLLHQDDANRHFVPVEALVQNTQVKVHSGKSVSYSPEATYTYVVDGKSYQCDRVLAVRESASSSWANEMLNRIERVGGGGREQGFKAVAYVNPADPTDAILVRTYLFYPYGFSMGALFGAVLGVGVLFRVVDGARTTMAAVALDDSGWQLLLPSANLKRQFHNAVFWLVGVIIAMVPLAAHWVFVAEQHGPVAWIVWAATLAVVGFVGMLAFRRWSVSRHMSDVRLRVRPVPLKRGEGFALELEADALSPLRVEETTAGVVCVEHYKERRGNKTNYGTRTHKEEKLQIGGAAQVRAGDVLSGKGEVTLADCPPTTDITVEIYPYYTWEIRVAVKLEGMVDYLGVFPLEVV